MIFETLILSTMFLTLGACIGYFYGKTHADSLFDIDTCGWKISAWKSIDKVDKYIICAKNGNRETILTLRPTEFDFDFIENDDETR